MNRTRKILEKMIEVQSPNCEFGKAGMRKYRIINQCSGVDIGIYEAGTIAGALDAMAIDAGYRNYSELEPVVPAPPGEIVVIELK